MELKPPAIIAIIVVVLILLIGGFVIYDKRQKAALNAVPPLSKSRYMPPPRPTQ